MGSTLINLGVLILIGVILANILHNAAGTAAFFNGLGGLWGASINGLLGKPASKG
jgi:hypothetical protein